MFILATKQTTNAYVEFFAVFLRFNKNLLAELSCGCQYKSDWSFIFLQLPLVQDVNNHGPDISECFTTSRLGDSNNIPSRKSNRECLSLNWCWFFKVVPADQIKKLLRESKVTKAHNWPGYLSALNLHILSISILLYFLLW